MRFLRLIGWLLILVALGLLAHEVYLWATTGEWKLLAAGQLWFDLHKDSLLLVQPAIERYLWPPLWDPIETALTWPAWAVIGGIGLIVLALTQLVRRRRRSNGKRRIFKS
jgi:hypothetical protein